MFRIVGNATTRYWPVLLVLWVAVLIGMKGWAPEWDAVVRDGEFRYLPEEMPSREAQELFGKAFSRDLLGSSIVIVVHRERGDGLTDADREFIENELKPRLQKIADKKEYGGQAVNEADDPAKQLEDEAADAQNPKPIVARIRTYTHNSIGHLLESEDQKASLVMVELTTEFMEYRNAPLIAEIEELVGENGELFNEGRIPDGLAVKLSGSATVGRDMRQAARESASATESWTILLVVALLIVIYRAPALAIIPLATVYIAVSISIGFLALLADAELIQLFNGIEVYVTVVLYGAGVDYCVFLMARYKEELDAGATYEEAISAAVQKVGAALAASAGTTMCGIGMMAFAQFGKFQQAGIAMSMSLFFVLCAALTFTPVLLRLAGRWAFWPNIRNEQVSVATGWISPTSLMARLIARKWFSGVWDKVGHTLQRRPGTVWLGCIGVMLPFAAFGIWNFEFLSYGLLKELPDSNASVKGAHAVQQHFPAGATGPVTALLVNRHLDFTDRSAGSGINAIRELTSTLNRRKEQFGIADIRSVSHPLGHEGRGKITIFQQGVINKRAPEFYVSDKGELARHVTRMEFVLQNDPFSRNSMDQFDRLKQALAVEVNSIGNGLANGTQLHYIGSTASIRDLKTVTSSDQVRVDILVVTSVFLILVILLRRPAISGYLILSVFFSYLVTLGFTFAVFWSLDPSGFSGLDWKVPMFLFTILIAVGEDYNIYLITRIEEEQLKHGPVKGVTVALTKTGSIISSCGLIMAGTFSSLMAGTLEGMNQLGFALAFGVLLDTFVVRPILVPAYLILLHSGRFGMFGKILGAQREIPINFTPAMRIGSDPTKGNMP